MKIILAKKIIMLLHLFFLHAMTEILEICQNLDYFRRIYCKEELVKLESLTLEKSLDLMVNKLKRRYNEDDLTKKTTLFTDLSIINTLLSDVLESGFYSTNNKLENNSIIFTKKIIKNFCGVHESKNFPQILHDKIINSFILLGAENDLLLYINDNINNIFDLLKNGCESTQKYIGKNNVNAKNNIEFICNKNMNNLEKKSFYSLIWPFSDSSKLNNKTLKVLKENLINDATDLLYLVEFKLYFSFYLLLVINLIKNNGVMTEVLKNNCVVVLSQLEVLSSLGILIFNLPELIQNKTASDLIPIHIFAYRSFKENEIINEVANYDFNNFSVSESAKNLLDIFKVNFSKSIEFIPFKKSALELLSNIQNNLLTSMYDSEIGYTFEKISEETNKNLTLAIHLEKEVREILFILSNKQNIKNINVYNINNELDLINISNILNNICSSIKMIYQYDYYISIVIWLLEFLFAINFMLILMYLKMLFKKAYY